MKMRQEESLDQQPNRNAPQIEPEIILNDKTKRGQIPRESSREKRIAQYVTL